MGNMWGGMGNKDLGKKRVDKQAKGGRRERTKKFFALRGMW